MSGEHSIQGGWRGNYYYDEAQLQQAGGFEAVFVEAKTSFSGSIMDDGVLGEADCKGIFEFPIIRFTKLYRTPGYEPIEYEGLMSDDGKSMSGTWIIRSENFPGAIITGTWTAKRWINFHMKDKTKEKEKDLALPGSGQIE